MDNTLTSSLLNEDGLNEREVAFLNVLFDECGGDVIRAMDRVGYPKGTASSEVTKKLNKHIKNLSKEYLISSSAKASYSLVSVLTDPGAIGTKQIIAASKDILDRAGIFKEEQQQVTEVRNMFILPAKEVVDDDE